MNEEPWNGEPYLIAHVVRGRAVFDIAIQLDGAGTESDPPPWWIIPTSGHRARPFAFARLLDAVAIAQFIANAPQLVVPEGHPDHYPATQYRAPRPAAGKPSTSLADLGL